MENYIKGKCLLMCPQEEIVMRTENHLVHPLEMRIDAENRTFAEPSLMVKCFHRSAAGSQMAKPENIRPPEILHQVVHHLLNRVICDLHQPFPHVYEFITDRLRAVRQDLIIQQPPSKDCISLLEPMVRFHAYSAYRLGGAPIKDFDGAINNKHFMECLKWLLNLYDKSNHMSEDRAEMEALYLVSNLGDFEALQRSIELPSITKNQLVKVAEELSLAWYLGNYHRVCKGISALPPLHAAVVAASQLPLIRRKALCVLSSAYNSKNIMYPLSCLTKILCYNSNSEAVFDCQLYGLDIVEENVHFQKTKFNSEEKKVIFRNLSIVDGKLKIANIPELLLCSSHHMKSV